MCSISSSGVTSGSCPLAFTSTKWMPSRRSLASSWTIARSVRFKLDVAASTLSHHLKTLLVVGLIHQERQTTTLICRANYDLMQSLVNFLLAECCADSACRPSTKKNVA